MASVTQSVSRNSLNFVANPFCILITSKVFRGSCLHIYFILIFVDDTTPVLELLSPQPIRIYDRRSGILTIQINATVTDATDSIVAANSSLLSASLIASDDATDVMLSYDSDTGQLVLSIPAVFYNSYVNATFNTSYFKIVLRSPISSLVSSISFAAEYLGRNLTLCRVILNIC